ncbi:CTSW [Cervus elaphus hippelaphus]|uniref:CTSW n=1 Tax=Cervus elaphus hippelaphus TaxID=46360 RepID=A0A212DG77_CEREH|nr:CTSW [Cervus elaphus hippelaphus]
MAPTVHLSCLLALLVAGLAQGIKGSLRGQHARRLDIFAQNLANAQRLQEEDLGTAEFGHYQKGVIKATPTTCDPTQVDHCVLLVGFGKTKSVEGRQGKVASFGSYSRPRRSMAYWTLQNSWGTHWGEKGYFRLHRGSNTCGITKFPVTARVDKPNKQQQVSCPP